MDPERSSLPRAISTSRRGAAADASQSDTHAIAIPGSAVNHNLSTSWHASTPPIAITSSRGAEQDGTPSALSRSVAWGGGSFIAGHSAFGRHGAYGSGAARSPASSRISLDRQPSVTSQHTGGPYLGLEPGLGLTAPFLDQHKREKAATAGDGSYAATPNSVAASESLQPFARVSLSHAAVAPAAATGGAAADAAAAAAAVTEAAEEKKAAGFRKLQQSVLYGIINAVVGIPTMISFAAIVYQDPLYKPLLGQLARVSFFSAAVHQLMFTIFSTLPFAVGQPQDVGLIFLSAMATGVAEIGTSVGLSEAEMVGTAMLTLTVATFVVGVMTWLVARFKLATLVQYVPLPVVGGYLGYVGYFCLAAGIGLGTNTTIDTFTSWTALASQDALIKLVPTLTAGLALWVCMTRADSPWALPLTLAAVPATFHAYLLLTGTSLAQAQDAGWVLKPEGKSTQQFWELYELFNIKDWRLDGVYLPALVRQIPKMLGLFFVVTFGSCLDVAAIQADMPFPIDFNSELGTVGLSNVIVGLSGSGYTGSYIFSQTIFSMRAGVSHWSHGAIIAALEAAIFLLPFSVVQYLPNFFFGALLTVFGIEIAGDWLVRSYAKVSTAEYLLLLATFLSILQLELEKGVAAGILLCTLYFAVTYARANLAALRVLPTRSAAVRSYAESHLLEALAGRLATVALSGFIFFGSSVLVSDKVIALAEDMTNPDKASSKAAADQQAAAGDSYAATEGSGAATHLSALRIASLAVQGSGGPLAPGEVHKGIDQERLAMLERHAPAFIILDFRRVLGVDATSAQTLSSLSMVLRRMGVTLIITRVTQRSIRRLLAAHGLISPADAAAAAAAEGGSNAVSRQHSSAAAAAAGGGQDPELQQPLLQGEEGDQEGSYCRVFDSLSAGAKYAEDRLLEMAESYGILQEPLTGLTLQQFLATHCQEALLTRSIDVDAVTAEVSKLGLVRHVPEGASLFSFGEVPESFFLILQGVVTIQVKSLALPHHSSRPLPAQLDVMEVERSFSSGQGAVVGVTDFVLKRLRSFQGVASTDVTVVEIGREALEVMVTEVPEVATAMQAVLLRDACLSEVYAYEVLERAAAA